MSHGRHYSAIRGLGFDIETDRLPSGKWLLRVNGVEMIFERQPEFTIPKRSDEEDMTMAQTTDRVSAIAARLSKITARTILRAAADPEKLEQLRADIRTVAASALRQDETRGPRRSLIDVLLNRK
jgi:hypothetical protein